MDRTEKTQNENFKKRALKKLSECLVENSKLKKKRSYWSTKCRKLEITEVVTLSTKIKDYNKNEKLELVTRCMILEIIA